MMQIQRHRLITMISKLFLGETTTDAKSMAGSSTQQVTADYTEVAHHFRPTILMAHQVYLFNSGPRFK